MKIFLSFIIALIIFTSAKSQMVVDTTHTPDYLVKNILAGKSSNIEIDNVSFIGDNASIGIFKLNLKYNDLIRKGIIMSTGNVYDAIGPNNSANKSSETYINSDKDLNKIINGNTFDAAILEFDFISYSDSISFSFFFASEEYPEYVDKNVNDVFAFFLINEDLKIKNNLALLADGETPISIDNISANKNSEYFIMNGRWSDSNILQWENNMQQGELAYTFQFDGFSTLLHVGSKVIPNTKYRLKLAIADVGDRLYDSAVFFEAGSFNSTGTMLIADDNFDNKLIEQEFSNNVVERSDNTITINLNIEFEFDTDKFVGEDSFKLLDRVYEIISNDKNIVLEVHGHTDNTGTKEYNQTLSENRAKNVANYLLEKGIESNRIKTIGYGYTKPISDDKVLNRRVEFVFKAR